MTPPNSIKSDADQTAVVVEGDARFTVITPHCIRLEVKKVCDDQDSEGQWRLNAIVLRVVCVRDRDFCGGGLPAAVPIGMDEIVRININQEAKMMKKLLAGVVVGVAIVVGDGGLRRDAAQAETIPRRLVSVPDDCPK